MKCLYLMPVKAKVTGAISYVPCGKCLACKLNRQQALAVRCSEEYKHSACALFVTLTYNDDNLPMIDGHPTLSKDHVQLYIKRVRKELSLVNIKLRYVLAGEYGDKGNRPHYHALFFFSGVHEGLRKTLSDQWPYGFTYIGTVTSASINYTLKYTLKSELYDKEQQEFKRREREFRSTYHDTLRNLSVGEYIECEDEFESSLQSGQEHTLFGECCRGQVFCRDLVDGQSPSCGTCPDEQQENALDVPLSEREKFHQSVVRPFRLFSNRPGIGFCFKESINESLDYYIRPGGLKLPVPRYWREKFWTDEHKKQYKEYYESISKMASQTDTEEAFRLRLARRLEAEKIIEQRQKRKKSKL